MLENPRLEIADWARIFGLAQEIAAELGLSAGPTQEHDQVLRHIAGQGEAMVVFDEGQGEIKTGADACRSPDRTVLYIDRTFFDFHVGKARLQHIQQPPMRSSSATIKQAALSQEKSSSTDGNDATHPGSRASNPIRDPCPFLFGLSPASDNDRFPPLSGIEIRKPTIRQQAHSREPLHYAMRLGGGNRHFKKLLVRILRFQTVGLHQNVDDASRLKQHASSRNNDQDRLHVLKMHIRQNKSYHNLPAMGHLKLQAYRIQNRESWPVGRLENPNSFRRSDQIDSIKEINDRNPELGVRRGVDHPPELLF